MSHNAKWEARKVEKELVSGRIMCSLISEDGEFFGFRVSIPQMEMAFRDGAMWRKRAGKLLDVWVMRDQEGNGCGSLSVEEAKDVVGDLSDAVV